MTLADRYGVGRQHIWQIISGVRWNPNGEMVRRKLGKRGNAKLTKEQILEIRSLYDKKTWPHRRLAERYGVTQSNISMILKHVTWK